MTFAHGNLFYGGLVLFQFAPESMQGRNPASWVAVADGNNNVEIDRTLGAPSLDEVAFQLQRLAKLVHAVSVRLVRQKCSAPDFEGALAMLNSSNMCLYR